MQEFRIFGQFAKRKYIPKDGGNIEKSFFKNTYYYKTLRAVVACGNRYIYVAVFSLRKGGGICRRGLFCGELIRPYDAFL